MADGTGYVDAMGGRALRVRQRPRLIAFLVYAALAVLLFSRAWASPRTSWVGDPGDPPMFMWSLRWLPYALTHGMNPFFTHHIDSLHGVNLLWDTSVPLPAFLLAPITLLLGPVVAFNVAATAAVALSAWCAYLCYRRYVASHLAAVTGGLLYGFSPYAIAHAHGGHLNLSLAFTPPLVLLLLDEILVRQRHGVVVVGGALGALAAAQLLIGQEMLATEALAAVVGVASLVIVCPRQVRSHLPYAARAFATALGVFAVLAAVPVGLALFSSRRPHGTVWGPDTYVSDLYGFVLPTTLQQLRTSWSVHVTSHFTDSCCIADTNTYVGVPMIVLLTVAAITRWSRVVVRVITIVALAMVVLSLGPHLHIEGHVTSLRMPESLVASVPLLANMLVSRLMLYFYLCAGLLCAVFLDGIRRTRGPDGSEPEPGAGAPRRRVPDSWMAPLSIGLVVLALAFLFPRVPFPATHATVPAFFESADVRRIPAGSVALVAPFARDTSTSEPMLWQAVAGMRYRTPEGYALGPDNSGRYSFLPVPTTLSTLMQSVQDGTPAPPLSVLLRRELIGELRSDDVETVIVGPLSQRGPMVALFTSLLGTAPEEVGGVDVWWDVARLPAVAQ